MEKTGLRKKSLEEIDRVQWVPHWGRERIYGMIENRPDWCVSRQRAWGVPITVFYCQDCEALLLDEAIMEKVYRLFAEHGADVWFEFDTDHFLPEETVCGKCGGKSFKKENDILDVWFDSGVSHAAVLEQRDYLKWPADLYLEGSDQHRGWFHSSLLTAVGTRGKAPYDSVLTHGFVVDADGRKMSKSLGNVIAPKEVIDKYGAEILRLWVTASDYREDIRISNNILKQLTDAYRRIRNTSRFMLGNLYDFDPQRDAVATDAMPEIDRFALHRLQELTERILRAYQEYEYHIIYHRLYNYCTLDLSAFYLDILKDRLYTSPAGSSERRSAQTAIYHSLKSMALLMAPILAFTAEEIWKYLPGAEREAKSVHLALLPKVRPEWQDEALNSSWQRILEVRSEVTKTLEDARARKQIGHPLDAAVTLAAGRPLYDILAPHAPDLRSIFIVSRADLVHDRSLDNAESEADAGDAAAQLSIEVEPAGAQKCERCWIHKSSVGSVEGHPSICRRCGDVLNESQ